MCQVLSGCPMFTIALQAKEMRHRGAQTEGDLARITRLEVAGSEV